MRKLLNQKSADCHCFNSCNSVEYSVLKTAAPLRRIVNHNHSDEEVRKNFVGLSAFFSSNIYTKTSKKPIYNFTDFLANTGGLLSFLIGFSLLSIVELLFYVFWLNWKKYVINHQTDKVPDAPVFTFTN
ncbi:sodium channel protein Nach-like [Rhynchophorus ferrugineus]